MPPDKPDCNRRYEKTTTDLLLSKVDSLTKQMARTPSETLAARQNGRTRSIPGRIAKREDPIYSPHCTVWGGGVNQGPPGVGFRQPDWGRGLGPESR